MTSGATISHRPADTQHLTCVGKCNADKIRKSRNELCGLLISAPIWASILPYFVFGKKAALSVIADPLPWFLCVTAAAAVLVLANRFKDNEASWAEAELQCSKEALHISYPKCKKSLKLDIPWFAIGEIVVTSPSLRGDNVKITVRATRVLDHIRNATKASLGSSFLYGSPWSSRKTFGILSIRCDAPPAAEACNLIRYWRTKNLGPKPSVITPPAAAPAVSVPPTTPAPKVDAPTEVDLSSATYAELLSLPGIGPAEAALVLKCRVETGGPYSLQELATLLRLKPHSAQRLRDKVTFSKQDPGALSKPDRNSEPTSQSEVKRPAGGREID